MIDEIRLAESSVWYTEQSEEEAYCEGWNDCNRDWMQRIEIMPRVGEWIPCSERLPEDTKTKAITFADGSVDAGYYSEEKWWCVGDSVRLEVVKTENVIAWMPLPEPYEEGEHEKGTNIGMGGRA